MGVLLRRGRLRELRLEQSRPRPDRSLWARAIRSFWGRPVHVRLDGSGTDSICDAYAVNLAEDGTVWVYFYAEFPLVSIRAGVYRSWKLGIAGAGALAVRHGQALLFGDCEQRSLGRIVALDGDDATVVDEVLIHDARGEPLDKALAYGSGERLLFFKERQALVVPGW